MDRLFCVYLALVFALTLGSAWMAFLALLIPALILLLCKRRGGDGAIALKRRPAAPGKGGLKLFALLFLIVLAGIAVYWLAYYPGGFNLDAYGQWDQAHGAMEYSDWHPLASTLLIQLAVSIRDSFAFCIFIQIAAFSLSVALLLTTLARHGLSDGLAAGIALYIALNPAIALNVISLTKDVQFAIFGILMADALLRVYFTDGKWLARPGRWLYLALPAALLCLVRHNGILFALPALLLTLLCHRDAARKVLRAALLAALCVGIVKVPVARLLDVRPHDDPVGEAVGIPMAIMANALVSEPDALPGEVHEFLNEIASDAEWNEHYCLGEWDSCKWIFPNAALCGQKPPATLLRYTLLTIEACPESAYESFRENTSIVWQPLNTPAYWVPEVYIEENEYGIEPAPVGFFRGIASGLMRASLRFPLSILCWNTGTQIILVMLAFLLARDKRYNASCYLYAPLFAYDFGTMLLLAGPNQRYFFCNAVLFLPLIAAVLLERGDACQGRSS